MELPDISLFSGGEVSLKSRRSDKTTPLFGASLLLFESVESPSNSTDS
jgi:hypothetical protein